MKNPNTKGQALIEAVISLPLILSAMGGISLALYHGLLFYVADYNLHESLVCLHYQSARTCQSEAETKIKVLLPKKSSVAVQISKGSKVYSGRLSISGITKIQISKRITL